MDKLMKDLLKEAHDHGYGIGRSNLQWSEGKSWTEFLKQNNIPLLTKEQNKEQVAFKAILLRGQGFTYRGIASVLGYPHPQSVKNLITQFEKQKNKRKKEDK
jgi:hypothetical protein